MALKHSSSFASLKSRFRPRSSSGAGSSGGAGDSKARDDVQGAAGTSATDLTRVSTHASTSSTAGPATAKTKRSASTSLMKRPAFLRSSSSSQSGGSSTGGGSGSTSEPSNSASSSPGPTTNAHRSLSRWKDAPPLPASTRSNGSDRMTLGSFPPISPSATAAPVKAQSNTFSVQVVKRNTDTKSQLPPPPPSVPIEARARMSAAEQGAQFRRRSASQGATESDEGPRIGRPPSATVTPSVPSRSQSVQHQQNISSGAGSRLLPGQQPAPSSASMTRASRPPPSAASQALAVSQLQLLPGQQSRPTSTSYRPPPSSSSSSLGNAKRSHSSVSLDTGASKVKNRVSITPGKESWNQVQAREQREAKEKLWRQSQMQGHGHNAAMPPPSAMYTGYGPSHGAPPPSSARSSYYQQPPPPPPAAVMAPGPANSNATPPIILRQGGPRSDSTHQHHKHWESQSQGHERSGHVYQRPSIAAQALAAERSRSLHGHGGGASSASSSGHGTPHGMGTNTSGSPMYAARVQVPPLQHQPGMEGPGSPPRVVSAPRPHPQAPHGTLPQQAVAASHPAHAPTASVQLPTGWSMSSTTGAPFPEPPARNVSMNQQHPQLHQRPRPPALPATHASSGGSSTDPSLSHSLSTASTHTMLSSPPVSSIHVASNQSHSGLLRPFSALQARSSPIFSTPPPPFPATSSAAAQVYASCYCEENAYRLAAGLLRRPPFVSASVAVSTLPLDADDHLAADALGVKGSNGTSALAVNPEVDMVKEREREVLYRNAGLRWAVHVVFASNEDQNVALFAQRAGAAAGRGDGLVIWDYHVFVAVTAYLPVDGMARSGALPTPAPSRQTTSESLPQAAKDTSSTSTPTTATTSPILRNGPPQLSLPAFTAAARSSFLPPPRSPSLAIDADELKGAEQAYVARTWIYDFDSSLAFPPEYAVPGGSSGGHIPTVKNGEGIDHLPPPTPVPFEMYALATLRLNLFASKDGASGGGAKLPERLKPRFRIVPAQAFLDHFASDRRHMREDGKAPSAVAAGAGAVGGLQVPGRSRRGTVPGSPDGGVASVQVTSPTSPTSPASPRTDGRGPSSPTGASSSKTQTDGKVEATGWTKAPPAWASIVGKAARERGETNNLFERYVAMPSASPTGGEGESDGKDAAESPGDDQLYGIVVSAEEFVKALWTGAMPAVPGDVAASSPATTTKAVPVPTPPVSPPVQQPVVHAHSGQGHAVGPRAPSVASPPPSAYRPPPMSAVAAAPGMYAPHPQQQYQHQNQQQYHQQQYHHQAPVPSSAPQRPPSQAYAVHGAPARIHAQQAQHQLPLQPQQQHSQQEQRRLSSGAGVLPGQMAPPPAPLDAEARRRLSHRAPPAPAAMGQPQGPYPPGQYQQQAPQAYHPPPSAYAMQQQQHHRPAQAGQIGSMAGAAGVGANGICNSFAPGNPISPGNSMMMPNRTPSLNTHTNGNQGQGHQGPQARGGRVESPYFAAYLQASYEARAVDSSSPASPTGSSASQGVGVGIGAGAGGSQPTSPMRMSMAMGAGSMSLLRSTQEAAFHHAAAASAGASGNAASTAASRSRAAAA